MCPEKYCSQFDGQKQLHNDDFELRDDEQQLGVHREVVSLVE